jgi:F0F1-type ATP synthase assembly protein I
MDAPTPHEPPAGGTSQPEDPGSRRSVVRARMEAMRTWGSLASVGTSFVLAVVIGTVLGAWLDRVTGWGPVFFLLFFFCGLAAGFLNVYRAVKNAK